MTRPNDKSTSYTYDLASQLTNLTHGPTGNPLSSFGYSYDNVGNRTSMSTTRSAIANTSSPLNYVYDNIYRLTQATRPLTANPNETFSYDSVGNRLNRDTQTTNSTFDAGNRLLSDANFNYTYDNNGNMTSKTNIITNQTISFVYDAENQLIQINLPNGDVTTYKYDGLGRRIEKSVIPFGGVAVTTRYVYDNEDVLFEFNGANALQASYVHGPGIDEPLLMNRGGSNYYYHTDGLGSSAELTNSAGNVVEHYIYDSFGQMTVFNASSVPFASSTVGNPYTYTGREYDPESGLYFYRARFYNLATGRFKLLFLLESHGLDEFNNALRRAGNGAGFTKISFGFFEF